MSILNNLLCKNREQINSYADFWKWFIKNEKAFFRVVKEDGNIEKAFFRKLAPKLNELNDGFFYLTGMQDDNTVELVITADGTIKNFVFVEELINAAPYLAGWKFTALKPALNSTGFAINMAGYKFSEDNISFYPNNFSDYPDEIDITVVHHDLDEENQAEVTNGTYIFLDNFLGELDFATTIDNLTVTGKDVSQKELIPIQKLKDYLIWRQKEFIEKYEGLRHNTENDNYSILEAELENGNPLLAIINTDLLEWDSKASHPWILNIEIKYNGEENKGLPDEETYKLLDDLENAFLEELKDSDGYLNIGRQTADNIREIYFACKDFRKPSKTAYQLEQSFADKLDITYDIYKDKYWQSFNRFANN